MGAAANPRMGSNRLGAAVRRMISSDRAAVAAMAAVPRSRRREGTRQLVMTRPAAWAGRNQMLVPAAPADTRTGPSIGRPSSHRTKQANARGALNLPGDGES
ncbi:MAG: hypothetical protein Kow00100_23900 [Geothermobacteraceae bacterium]